MASNPNRNNINNLFSSLENEFLSFVNDYSRNYINNLNNNNQSIPSQSSRQSLDNTRNIVRPRNETNIPAPSPSPSPIQPQAAAVDLSGNDYFRDEWRRQQHNISDLIELMNNNMRDYNTNFYSMINDYNYTMNEYNRNIDNLIDLLIMTQRDLNSLRQNDANDNYINRDNIIHNTRRNYQNNRRTLLNPLRHFPQPRAHNPLSRNDRFHTYLFTLPLNVRENNNVDRLTNQQIENSTEVVSYSSQISEIRCPISWEDFTIGERVCQIKHCKHTFKTTPLMDWFSRNTSCPVCRYDLRNYREQSNANPRIDVSNNVLESIIDNYDNENENENEEENDENAILVTTDSENGDQQDERDREDRENENDSRDEETIIPALTSHDLDHILDEVMRGIGNTLSNTVYDISNSIFEVDVTIEPQL
jgi:hypothetical protein